MALLLCLVSVLFSDQGTERPRDRSEDGYHDKRIITTRDNQKTTPHTTLSDNGPRLHSGLSVSSVSLVSSVSNRFDKNDKQTITTNDALKLSS